MTIATAIPNPVKIDLDVVERSVLPVRSLCPLEPRFVQDVFA